MILERNCPFKAKEDHLYWVMKLTKFYIKQVGKDGGVISRSMAISAAKVLLERDESFGKIEIPETWGKSLLKRMGVC